jgi:hypothetical protein
MKEKRNILPSKEEVKANKGKFAVYFVLRLSVIGTMIAQAYNHNYNDVFLCVLTLVLFLVPSFIEKRLNISLPNTLEIIMLLFIYSAEILGEIRQYYLMYDRWDDMLHTLNGFLCAAIGFSLIDILNRSEKFHITLSPIFVAMVSFCFSMTIGVLWEFFEYFMDTCFNMDMQKDRLISSISSVMLNPQGVNVPVTVSIESVVVNGEPWIGYIDIGLKDTMSDLFVNFIGALVFSVVGLFYIKGRGKGTFAKRFIPTLKNNGSARSPKRGDGAGNSDHCPVSENNQNSS